MILTFRIIISDSVGVDTLSSDVVSSSSVQATWVQSMHTDFDSYPDFEDLPLFVALGIALSSWSWPPFIPNQPVRHL